MAKFVLAGRVDCPQYARAEMLAENLRSKLPYFEVNKIVVSQEEWPSWVQDVCKSNGWSHPPSSSPLIWRELIYRGGKGVYMGGLQDFKSYTEHFYNIVPETSEDVDIKIAAENLDTYNTEKLEEAQNKPPDPLRVCITNSSSPLAYHLASCVVLDKVFGEHCIHFQLLDMTGNKEAVHGLAMELQDLAHPKVSKITCTDSIQKAFEGASAVFVLDEFNMDSESLSNIRSKIQEVEIQEELIFGNEKHDLMMEEEISNQEKDQTIPEVKSNLKSESQNEVQAAKAQADEKTDAQADKKNGVQAEQIAEAQAEEKNETKAEDTQAKEKNEAQANGKIDTKAKAEKEESEVKMKVKADEKNETQAEEENEAQIGEKTKAEENSEAQAEEKNEAQTEEKSEAQAKEKSEAQAEEKSEAQAEEKSEAQAKETAEAQAEEKSEAQAEEKSEAQAEEKSDAQAEEKSEVQAEEKNEAQTENTKEEAGIKSEAQAENMNEDQKEVLHEVDVQQVEGKSQPKDEVQVNTKTDSEEKTDPQAENTMQVEMKDETEIEEKTQEIQSNVAQNEVNRDLSDGGAEKQRTQEAKTDEVTIKQKSSLENNRSQVNTQVQVIVTNSDSPDNKDVYVDIADEAVLCQAAITYDLYGGILDYTAQKDVRVVIVGQYSNTGAALISNRVSSIDHRNFIASSSLAESQATAVLASKLGIASANIRQVGIWGRSQGEVVPDASSTEVYHYQGSIIGPDDFSLGIKKCLFDYKWLKEEFPAAVLDRHNYISNCYGQTTRNSVHLPEAISLGRLMKDWWAGVETWHSVGVVHEGEDIAVSCPCVCKNGIWEKIKDAPMEDRNSEKLARMCSQLKFELEKALALVKRKPGFGQVVNPTSKL